MTDFRRDTLLGLDDPATLVARVDLQALTIQRLVAALDAQRLTTARLLALLAERCDHQTQGMVKLVEWVGSISDSMRAGAAANVALCAAVEDATLRVRALEMRAAGRAGVT